MATIKETNANWILIKGDPPTKNDMTEVIDLSYGVKQLLVKDEKTHKWRVYEYQFPKDNYTKKDVSHFENYTSELLKTLNEIQDRFQKIKEAKNK